MTISEHCLDFLASTSILHAILSDSNPITCRERILTSLHHERKVSDPQFIIVAFPV